MLGKKKSKKHTWDKIAEEGLVEHIESGFKRIREGAGSDSGSYEVLWGCEHCAFLNGEKNDVCEICGRDRPENVRWAPDNGVAGAALQEQLAAEQARSVQASLQKQQQSKQRILYVKTLVNGRRMDALVDTGAESSVLSLGLAEDAGLLHLVDTRYAGVAVGVGAARIVGRIPSAPIALGKRVYNHPLIIIDNDSIGFLLGLDFLSDHNAMVNVRKQVLIIGSGRKKQRIRFLSQDERHIPTPTSSQRTPRSAQPIECPLQ